MEKHDAPVSIDHSKCVSCPGLICLGVCPYGVIESGLDNKPQVSDVSCCTRCGVCVDLCPVNAIVVAKREGRSVEKV